MKRYFFLFITLLLTGLAWSTVRAQSETTWTELPDSILEKKHSPTKATIMSACLPGLGQIYNKKIWKVPIIYAGFGVLGYFIYFNTDEYINYKCAYIESSYGNMNGSYAYLVQRYSKEELLSAREYYRRNLEISCLITAVWYALNILDATVDAHLFTYNISDKLSFRMEPSWMPAGITRDPGAGLRLTFNF